MLISEDYFFCVDCATMDIYERALALLNEYPEAKKIATPMGDGVFLVVFNNDGLAEAAFQMNWIQKGEFLCQMCKWEIERTGEGESTCGHLTFTKPIN